MLCSAKNSQSHSDTRGKVCCILVFKTGKCVKINSYGKNPHKGALNAQNYEVNLMSYCYFVEANVEQEKLLLVK